MEKENVSTEETIVSKLGEENVLPPAVQEEDKEEKIKNKEKITIDTELNFISTEKEKKSLEKINVLHNLVI